MPKPQGGTGVAEPAAEQQQCHGILHCKFIKELGYEIKAISAASPAKSGTPAAGDGNDGQTGAMPGVAGTEDDCSTGSESIGEAWVLHGEPLGVEASASHIRTESTTGVLCSTNPNTLVFGRSVVSTSTALADGRSRFCRGGTLLPFRGNVSFLAPGGRCTARILLRTRHPPLRDTPEPAEAPDNHRHGCERSHVSRAPSVQLLLQVIQVTCLLGNGLPPSLGR